MMRVSIRYMKSGIVLNGLADKKKIQTFGRFLMKNTIYTCFYQSGIELKNSKMRRPFTPYLIACCMLLSTTVTTAQVTRKKESVSQSASKSKSMDRHVSELMADKIEIKKEIKVDRVVDDIEHLSYEELLESEELRFPADELYGSSWDNSWVNPFLRKDIAIPDSFIVDCRSFSAPIDGHIKVTSPYGPRWRRMHRGIDLKVQVGDTIRAAFSGKVRIKGYERRGYGHYLVIRHPNGLETIYGHLSRSLVSDNQIVKTGQAIGLGGNTGRSTGAHLHFETRFLGIAFNPTDIIDFESGTPHHDYHALYKHKLGRSYNNFYTSTSERIIYHRVKKGESLSKIAKRYGLTVKALRRMNGLSKKSVLRVGQSLRCGTKSIHKPSKKKINQPSEPIELAMDEVLEKDSAVATKSTAAYHTVGANETLVSIAQKYGTTVDALCRLNNIRATTSLQAGQNLCYRAEAKPKSKPEANQTASSNETNIADASTDEMEQEEMPEVVNKKKTSSSKSAKKNKNKKVYYKIRKGDTLGAIARRHGVSVQKLCELNKISKTTVLNIGRSLRCS